MQVQDLNTHLFLPFFVETYTRIWQSFLCLMEGKDDEAVQILKPWEIQNLKAIYFFNIKENLALAACVIIKAKISCAVIN
jgi:hypothetical protein